MVRPPCDQQLHDEPVLGATSPGPSSCKAVCPTGDVQSQDLGVNHVLKYSGAGDGAWRDATVSAILAPSADGGPVAAGGAGGLDDNPGALQGRLERLDHEEDVAWNSGSPAVPLQVHLEGEDFLEVVCQGYSKDTLFSKIISNISHHPKYSLQDRVLYFMNAVGNLVITVPGSLSKGRRVTKVAIDQAHHIVGHKAARKTRDYLAHWY
jgi:hypothetical protein